MDDRHIKARPKISHSINNRYDVKTISKSQWLLKLGSKYQSYKHKDVNDNYLSILSYTHLSFNINMIKDDHSSTELRLAKLQAILY